MVKLMQARALTYLAEDSLSALRSDDLMVRFGILKELETGDTISLFAACSDALKKVNTGISQLRDVVQSAKHIKSIEIRSIDHELVMSRLHSLTDVQRNLFLLTRNAILSGLSPVEVLLELHDEESVLVLADLMVAVAIEERERLKV